MNNTEIVRLLRSRRFIAMRTVLQTGYPAGVNPFAESKKLEAEIQNQLEGLKYE